MNPAASPRGRLVLDEPGGPAAELPGPGEARIVVGRDPACEVPVPFDDTHTSWRHAGLAWASPGRWTVTDLCSSNGTIVGGLRVEAPVLAGLGDVLQVGRTVYRIEPVDGS